MPPMPTQLPKPDAGGDAIAATTDVSDETATQEMAVKTVAFGRIDGLVNASLMSVLERRDWHLIPIDEWDRVQEVNMRGVFLCSKAVYPQMRKRRRRDYKYLVRPVLNGTPNRLHYSTSKAGVIGPTRSLAREIGPTTSPSTRSRPAYPVRHTGILVGRLRQEQRPAVRPLHSAASVSGGSLRCGDVPFVAGRQLYFRADAECRWRAAHALTRAEWSAACDTPITPPFL